MNPTGSGTNPAGVALEEGGVPMGGGGTSPGGGDGRSLCISGDIAEDSVCLVEDARGVEGFGLSAADVWFVVAAGGDDETGSLSTVGLYRVGASNE